MSCPHLTRRFQRAVGLGPKEFRELAGMSEREYRFALGDRFIQVNGKSTYPPQGKNPKGEVHDDVGFMSYDTGAQKLVLKQFHIEGFVNHCVLDSISEDGRTIMFVTAAIENIPAGWASSGSSGCFSPGMVPLWVVKKATIIAGSLENGQKPV